MKVKTTFKFECEVVVEYEMPDDIDIATTTYTHIGVNANNEIISDKGKIVDIIPKKLTRKDN